MIEREHQQEYRYGKYGGYYVDFDNERMVTKKMARYGAAVVDGIEPPAPSTSVMPLHGGIPEDIKKIIQFNYDRTRSQHPEWNLSGNPEFLRSGDEFGWFEEVSDAREEPGAVDQTT